jgi:hypothetical protein
VSFPRGLSTAEGARLWRFDATTIDRALLFAVHFHIFVAGACTCWEFI